ncbi:MAG: hypothetical protein IKT32_05525, partial [Clostridia bacterium]|nr:hypothetical protein [Clostridia bacterium]
MSENYTDNLKKSIAGATTFAMKYNSEILGSEHLLFGLLSIVNCTASKISASFGLSANKVEYIVDQTAQKGIRRVKPQMTVNTSAILQRSLDNSLKAGVGYVSTEHLLLALLQTPDCRACAIIRKLGVDIVGLTERVEGLVYA